MINPHWKCQLLSHKNSYFHLLHLSANSKNHLICLECKRENQIPDQEILSIHELLESDETKFFSTYYSRRTIIT